MTAEVIASRVLTDVGGRTDEPRPTEYLAQRKLLVAALVASLIVGVAVRAAPILTSDFPLTDGGLFLLMIEAVRQAHYVLPSSVAYNGLVLPFAYPPLGFYLGAVLADATRVGPIDLLRFIPLAASLLALFAFAGVALAALESRLAAVVAVALFAVAPGGYVSFLMGGGLTRGLGFLFAILALGQAYAMYARRPLSPALPRQGGGRRPCPLSPDGGGRRHVPLSPGGGGGRRRWHVGLCAACCALALLSHPAMAWFAAFSLGLVFLAFGRSRRGLVDSLVVGAGAVALSAPWWVVALRQQGLQAFLAAFQKGSLLVGSATGERSIESLLGLVALVLVVAVCLAMASRGHSGLFVLAWLGMIFVLAPRELTRVTIVPLALAGGVVAERAVALIASWRNGRASLVQSDTEVDEGARAPSPPPSPARGEGDAPSPPPSPAKGEGVAPSPLASPARGEGDVHAPPPSPAGAEGVIASPLAGEAGRRAEGPRTGEGASLVRLRAPGREALGWLATLFVAAAMWPVIVSLLTDRDGFVALSSSERAAMHWVMESTRPDARFVILTGHTWPRDRVVEWFPVLAQRESLVTPQGTEWTTDDRFGRVSAASALAQECARQTPACLDSWAAKTGLPVAYVYVERDAAYGCCAAMVDALRADGRYRVIYDEPAAAIFQAVDVR